MAPPRIDQRLDLLADTVRRLVRRGARKNLTRVLAKVRPEDVAQIMSSLAPAERLVVFRTALADFPDATGEVFVEMEPGVRLELAELLSPEEIAAVLKPLAVDDTVGVVDLLPEAQREPVLALLDLSDRAELQTQFQYDDDTAGRIMNTEFFALGEDTTVEQAIARVRHLGEVEMIFYLYVVDAEGVLAGVVSLRELLLANPARTLQEIMNRSLIVASTGTDQEEVARLASRYDLLAIPVVADENRLVGIVTVDDVIDIFQEEAEEDFYRLVGTTDDEVLYRERAWRVAGIRLPWLLVNLVGLILTGILVEAFQLRLSQAFLLTFAPVVMGMGGNIGSQTMTLAVRGLATGRLGAAPRQGRLFLLQQLKVAFLIGTFCALLAAGVALFLEGNAMYGVVVAVSLFLAILLASLNGSLLPILFQRLGIDPAVASGPIVTTSSDIMGILVYFGFATLMIDYLIP